MTSLQDLAKEKPLPRWMVNHPVFKSIGQVEKVFGNIGLSNTEEPCDIKGNFAIDEAEKLLATIISEIRAPLEVFVSNNYIEQVAFIEKVDDLFHEAKGRFITYNKDQIVLKLPEAITINNVVKFPKGSLLFDVYYYCLNEFSRFAWVMPQLEKLPGWKDFNSNNVSSDNSSIVFASDGIDGLWDIATMSMRGITSCIRWDGKFKLTLIGSIADPFTGIIYLTSGKKHGKYGTRMIKRCVVRFVVNSEKEKPYLLVDRMYPSLSPNVLEAFTNFLHSKSGLEVCFGPNLPKQVVNGSYIPRRAINDQLTEKTLTYRDTKISIGKVQTKVSERRDINVKVKEHNLALRLKLATPLAGCIASIENDPVAVWLRTADFQYLIGEYALSLVSNLSKRCPLQPGQSSTDHIKQMAYLFFTDKSIITKVENDKFLRAIKKYYAVYPDAKRDITMSALKPMFTFISDAIKKTMKAELINIIKPATPKNKKTKAE